MKAKTPTAERATALADGLAAFVRMEARFGNEASCDMEMIEEAAGFFSAHAAALSATEAGLREAVPPRFAQPIHAYKIYERIHDQHGMDDVEGARDLGADFVLDALATRLGVKQYEGADGSETWESDVAGTLCNILEAAKLIDPDDWRMSPPVPPASERAAAEAKPVDGEPVAWLYERPTDADPSVIDKMVRRSKIDHGHDWTETPLYTPAAIAAAEARGREAGIEDAAKWCEERAEHYAGLSNREMDYRADAVEIRALSTTPPDTTEKDAVARDCLPIGHSVLEQADMLDGRVSQTVRDNSGLEYERVVHADEAYSDAS